MEKFYIFCSFDLTNSTMFKSKYNKWPVLFFDIFSKITNSLNKIKLNHWKSIGDEITYYINIQNKNEIFSIIKHIYNTTIEINDYLLTNKNNYKKILSIKSTTWWGIVKDIKEIKAKQNSDILLNVSFLDHGVYDFIGENIDIGFRISKYAYRNVVTLSSGLAYMLYIMNCKEFITNSSIIAFKELKGVIKREMYPIVWFSLNSDKVNKVENNENNYLYQLYKNKLTYSLKELEKVYSTQSSKYTILYGLSLLKK